MNDGFLKLPNDWIDRALPTMTPAEWMVMTVILRQTLGWQKERDAISLTQLQQKTGLSRHTVIDAIRGLAKRGWIKAYEQGIRSVYEPCFDAGAEIALDETSAEIAPPLVQKLHQASAEIAPEVVQKLHTQKTKDTNQKKNKDRVQRRASRARAPVDASPVSGDPPPEEQKAFKRNGLSAEEDQRQKELFYGLAEICVLDSKIKGGQIKNTATKLRNADEQANGEALKAFLEWWKTSHFLGHKGVPPSLYHVMDNWRKFRENYAERTTRQQQQQPVKRDVMSVDKITSVLDF